MTIIPIDETDIAPARALRVEFARFWSTAEGEPRDVYDRFVAATPMAAGVTTRPAGDDSGWWCEPAEPQPGRVILFIHGGGYGLGHASAYRGFVSQIVARAGVPALALEYPLAPEAAVGPALELAVAALGRLAAAFASVAVVADSAGGGLAIAAALEARRRDLPISALVAFSPWTDLTLSGQSARDFAVGDPLLDVAYLKASADAYRGSTPATDPRVSPLFAEDLRLPPILIQVGLDEVLLDDSRRLAERARAAGSEVTFEEWQGMHHVFPLNVAQLGASRRALDAAAGFLAAHWPR